MRRSWLMCALLSALAWGQAQPGAPPPAHAMPAPGSPAAKAADDADDVAMNAVVLTIEGVCKPKPRPAAAAAGKSGAATAKPAAKPAAKTEAKTDPADCKTTITRAEFEKLEDALQPHVTPQLKRQLEGAYPSILAFAMAAQKEGLDKGEHFDTLMKFWRAQILSNEMKRRITDEASKLSDKDIADYYQEHLTNYQEFNLERVFLPHYRPEAPQVKAEDKDDKDAKDAKDDKDDKGEKDEKLAAEKEEKAKADRELQEAKEADALRVRAAAGEDFAALEKDAYAAAGMKMEPPSTSLPKVRRNTLPPGQSAVFELKEGEVSQVITDSGGHYIYKVKAITQGALDDPLKNEIKGMLQGQRQREAMEKYQKSFKAVPNEAYFGPAAPAGPQPGMPPMRNPPNRVPMTPPAGHAPSQPGAAPPAAQPSTTPPPASSPN